MARSRVKLAHGGRVLGKGRMASNMRPIAAKSGYFASTRGIRPMARLVRMRSVNRPSTSSQIMQNVAGRGDSGVNPSLVVVVSAFTALGPSSFCPISTSENRVDAASFDPAPGIFCANGRPGRHMFGSVS